MICAKYLRTLFFAVHIWRCLLCTEVFFVIQNMDKKEDNVIHTLRYSKPRFSPWFSIWHFAKQINMKLTCALLYSLKQLHWFSQSDLSRTGKKHPYCCLRSWTVTLRQAKQVNKSSLSLLSHSTDVSLSPPVETIIQAWNLVWFVLSINSFPPAKKSIETKTLWDMSL